MWTQKKKTLVAGGAAVVAIGLAVGVFLAYGTGSANAGPSELTLHPERHDEIVAMRRAEGLAERLELTPEQTREVAIIVQRIRQDAIELRARDHATPMERIQARRQTIMQAASEIRAVLNPGQQAEFDAMRSELMGNAAMLRQAFNLPITTHGAENP